ncbi:MAG: DUF4386 family protein [Ilumatobacteraceae bacterium]
MDDKKWAKWATLGGVGFVILNVVGAIVMGQLPMKDDTNEEVLEWFVDKESGIRTAGFLGALSVILLVWWFGSLWRRMAQAETNQNRLSVMSLFGLASSGALFAGQAVMLSAVAMRVDDMGPEGARFYFTLGSATLAFAGAFVFIHLLATNMLALRSGFLPKWNAYLGFVPAALFLVSTTGTMSDGDLPMIAGGIGFITWSIWILATSFNMWKTAD